MEAFVLQAKISEFSTCILSWKQDLTFMFLLSRPIHRGHDGTLTMFQNSFVNMLKAAIQNVSNTEIDDSAKESYDQLKEETKELREIDIEGPWSRDIQPGQRSDEVID